MPANLPPQYSKAEEEYRKATTAAERLEKLREMFRILPKHKGTEKLQSDLKQKISRTRGEIEAASKSTGKKGGFGHRVSREGAGQVVLVGAPNAGKSAILGALTGAKPAVAPYPFTTRAYPAMMTWEDVRVQLVDLPPIAADFIESWVPNVIRSADAALLVVDLASDDVADAADAVLARLASVHTELVGTLPYDVEDEMTQHVKTMMVANKLDADGAAERLDVLREWFGPRFPLLAISAERGEGLDALCRGPAYDLLGVMRIYTKIPGKPPDRTKPFTIPIGSTVLDLAREIHRDFEQSLKFAKVWGVGVFEGQTVKRDHELHDADIVELHA